MRGVALLWDESFLWGLMAYKALDAQDLPFDLIRSADIRRGVLRDYRVLFVPGGWASNKLKSLGSDGVEEIRGFVREGGNYLGFCGGAGLATGEGLGLLDIRRRPTKERVPSFSGRILLRTVDHPAWKGLNEEDPSSPVFHAWWPSQFLIGEGGVKTLATYGEALPDAFSSDLNVGDVLSSGGWSDLEERYRINLDPRRLLGEPAVVEGHFGKGTVLLSLVHPDTPGDRNGGVVLGNLWGYLAKGSGVRETDGGAVKADPENRSFLPSLHPHPDSKTLAELSSLSGDIISLGTRNFLWFWRNPMLLQWRRGVRGLEYCTLYVMTREISERMRDPGGAAGTADHAGLSGQTGFRDLAASFMSKARQLLVLERLAMQDTHITYEQCEDPRIQGLRAELFSNSKSHGGMFKELLDGIDRVLYGLLRHREGISE